MSFLAPWALVVGVLGAAGVVLLHLVARQRPAAYLLPTAQFIPDRRTLVSRVSRRPRDLFLLLLRLVLILSAAMAFARPVLSPSRAPRARILLLDLSASVADPADVFARARTVLADGVPTRVVVFDSTAAVLGEGATALDSAARRPAGGGHAAGSISAALVAARRLGAAHGARADSVELLLVSPVSEEELDPATDSVRALWPGGIVIVRVAARSDTAVPWPLERALPADDVLWPALAGLAVQRSARSVRLVRDAPTVADSAFARAGGVVVRWDSLGARPAAAQGLAMGDDVVVASFGRDTLDMPGVVLARWADGAPAALESRLGDGCVRRVAVGIPLAGDLPLRPAFQQIVRGLAARCSHLRPVSGIAADPASIARLAGGGRAASGRDLSRDDAQRTPIATWLLALALVCALLEIALRARPTEASA